MNCVRKRNRQPYPRPHGTAGAQYGGMNHQPPRPSDDVSVTALRSRCSPNGPTTCAICYRFDETADRPPLSLLKVVDEHIHEALAVVRLCTADDLEHHRSLIALPPRSRASAGGNGPRAHRLGTARLLQPCWYGHQLHRARLTVGRTPLRRVVQRPHPRGVAQHQGVGPSVAA